MPPSHVRDLSPSPLLALVCLAVVHRLRPTWVALPLREAAAQEHVRPERLSRLTSRALEPFARVLSELTRRGRPPVDRHAERDELAILRALLAIARELLAFVPRRHLHVRALFVGAWLRLRDEHPTLTMKRFCQTLGLADRTLRHWLAHIPRESKSTTAPPPPEPTPRRRPPRRPRFGFDVVLPDTQYAADTTQLQAFGVPLKMLGLQDVGGRDQDLFDAILVDESESAALVASLVEKACVDLPGAQLLTDQGTPYMAERTRDALRVLEVEHAPNKEAEPTGKATVERAFLTVKSIAAPLLALSNELADRLPALREPELAKAATSLLVTALLRAYQAGARAARRAFDARGEVDPDALARAAAQQRMDVRADDRSSRLILARIHDAYALGGAAQTFVNRFRRYSPDVLLEAEKRFASQVHRDDIRDRSSYFAALVRGAHDELRRERLRSRREQDDARHRQQAQRQHDAQLAHWNAHPIEWLRDALDAFAAQWLPERQCLFADGAGIGHAWARQALARLLHLRGPGATPDLVASLLRDWSRHNLDQLGPDGVEAVLAVVRPHLDNLPQPTDELDCALRFVAAMTRNSGPPTRSAPPKALRT